MLGALRALLPALVAHKEPLSQQLLGSRRSHKACEGLLGWEQQQGEAAAMGTQETQSKHSWERGCGAGAGWRRGRQGPLMGALEPGTRNLP